MVVLMKAKLVVNEKLHLKSIVIVLQWVEDKLTYSFFLYRNFRKGFGLNLIQGQGT